MASPLFVFKYERKMKIKMKLEMKKIIHATDLKDLMARMAELEKQSSKVTKMEATCKELEDKVARLETDNSELNSFMSGVRGTWI